MGPAATILLLLAVLVALAVLAWGTVTKRRSIFVALVAVAVAGLAAMGSYYAFMETQSMSWGMGYALAAVLSAGVAGRHLLGASC